MSIDRPKRSLGQNFLQDPNTLRKIVKALGIQPHEILLEIGPGKGALTPYLLEKSFRVLALEKDWRFCPGLKEAYPQLQICNTDALRFAWEGLDFLPGIKIVGNLPYNIASPLIWELVSRAENFEAAFFMVQKEVALRICANPGKRVYGSMSAWVQNFASPTYLFTVPPGVFRPQPRVHSAFIRFLPLQCKGNIDKEILAKTIKFVFSRKRKQLKNILKDYSTPRISSWLEEYGLRGESRPEEIPPQAFPRLARLILGE